MMISEDLTDEQITHEDIVLFVCNHIQPGNGQEMIPTHSEGLTDEQIARQDEVDNKIFALIRDIVPGKKFDLPWDMEMIGGIRDEIQSWVVRKRLCTEYEFYPWMIEEDELADGTQQENAPEPAFQANHSPETPGLVLEKQPITPTTGYTATIYTATRCEDDCRMDIFNLDEVWSTPGEVIDRLVEERTMLLEQFDRMECREYYGKSYELAREPEEGESDDDVPLLCVQTFDKMIGVLREIVLRWNTRQAEWKQENPDKPVCMPLEVDEAFEDVSVRINAVAVYL